MEHSIAGLQLPDGSIGSIPGRNSSGIITLRGNIALYGRNMRVFTAVLYRETDVRVAACPTVGTVSQGRTVEEAVANLKETTES